MGAAAKKTEREIRLVWFVAGVMVLGDDARAKTIEQSLGLTSRERINDQRLAQAHGLVSFEGDPHTTGSWRPTKKGREFVEDDDLLEVIDAIESNVDYVRPKASCPKCLKVAEGWFAIHRQFGWRYLKRKSDGGYYCRPQSRCRVCRR